MFLRYFEARLNQYQLDLKCRIYITDALKLIAKNTGAEPARRWAETLRIEKPEKSFDEIVNNFAERTGLKVVAD